MSTDSRVLLPSDEFHLPPPPALHWRLIPGATVWRVTHLGRGLGQPLCGAPAGQHRAPQFVPSGTDPVAYARKARGAYKVCQECARLAKGVAA